MAWQPGISLLQDGERSRLVQEISLILPTLVEDLLVVPKTIATNGARTLRT